MNQPQNPWSNDDNSQDAQNEVNRADAASGAISETHQSAIGESSQASDSNQAQIDGAGQPAPEVAADSTESGAQYSTANQNDQPDSGTFVEAAGLEAADANPTAKATRRPLIITALIVTIVVLLALTAWLVYAIAFAKTPIENAYAECEGSRAVLNALYEDDTDTTVTQAELDLSKANLDRIFEEQLEGVLTIEDSGRTLVVKTRPSEDDVLGISSLVFACVLDELEVPSWVRENMNATRSIDGRQTAEWNGQHASWSYHPDNGVNLVITQK